MSDESEQNKSEDATPFKLTKAREKGTLARGTDLGFFTALTAFLVYMWIFGGGVGAAVKDAVRGGLVAAPDALGSQNALLLITGGMLAKAAGPLAFMAAVMFGVVLLFELVQTRGFVFSAHPLKPDFNRLNPAQGLKRLFTVRLLIETAKNVVKFGVYAGLTWVVVQQAMGEATAAIRDAASLASAMWTLALRLAACFAAAALAFAALDQIIVRRDFAKKMRMSRRDIRRESRDRGSKILSWLADVTVNQPYGDGGGAIDPAVKLPVVDLEAPAPDGSRQRLLELGPAGFAQALRAQTALAVTDTTFRDAHQSLLATRVRTKDLVAVLPHVARLTPELLSVEAWGGATYDVALRFLGEDPWERLARMREALPNVAIQMLLRGRNTVGYTPYPTEVTDAFVREAAATGVDIFRIFDALNDVDQMTPAIDAVLATGTTVAEVALCYTGDLLDPAENLYTLDYYLGLAEQIVARGAHILAIKDMAGLLRAGAAEKLVAALRENFDLPVHVHTHDTAGGQLATLLAASRAGADAVDAASAPMAGTTSQPSLSALVAATAHTDRDTGLSLDQVSDLEPYWEAVRRAYKPFESGLPGPTGRVYHHEIPGGQLSNLRQQAIALGLADDFEKIEDYYAAANRILGRIPKVTPSSKVVGDLALQLAASNADPADFEQNPDKYDIPDSVVGFMAGELGDLPGGWPEPFRSKVLKGRDVKVGITPITPDDQAALDGEPTQRRAALNRLLFAGPTQAYEQVREQYGDLSLVPTLDYLYGLRPGAEHFVTLEPGVDLLLSLEAIGEPDEQGMRSVMTTINGQLRPILVRDRSITVETVATEKADASVAGQIAAPFLGVVTLKVAEGDSVAAGQPIASIEAMKMEAAITTPVGGTVKRLAIRSPQQVEAGDLLIVVE